MGLFLGFSSGVSTFLGTGLNSAIEAYKLSEQRSSQAVALEEDIARTASIAIPAPARSEEVSITPKALPIHSDYPAIPAPHSLTHASHAGSLLEAAELAAVKGY